jgi:anti-sigma factor (TIGR02949 family)
MTDNRTSPAPIDCEHAVRQLWDYLDGRLPEEAREQVAAHLASCDNCTSHFVFERSFLESVRTLRRSDSQFTSLRERVRASIRRVGESGT